jgi:hypothetical protein
MVAAIFVPSPPTYDNEHLLYQELGYETLTRFLS